MWCRLAFLIGCFSLTITGKKQRCGIATVEENRIVYGKPAEKGANPWIVSLEMYMDRYQSWEHQCAGTLLDRQWILTAAHCFKETRDLPDPTTKWRIVAGQYDRKIEECSEQILDVGTIIEHEKYRPNDHRHDIALVLADGKFRTGGTYVRPACLPPNDMVYNDRTPCSIAGWGQHMYTIDAADMNKLLYYNSTIINRDECDAAAKKIEEEDGLTIGSVSEEMICIKSEFDMSKPYNERGTGGTCGGDSGGPLICKCGESQCLAGVVSWSLRRPCGYTHDVFTRLHVYLKWINEKRRFKSKSKKRPTVPDNC